MDHYQMMEEMLTDTEEIQINGEIVNKNDIAPVVRPKISDLSNSIKKEKTPSIKINNSIKKRKSAKFNSRRSLIKSRSNEKKRENYLLDDILLDNDDDLIEENKKINNNDSIDYDKKNKSIDTKTQYIKEIVESGKDFNPSDLEPNKVYMMPTISIPDSDKFFSAYKNLTKDQEFIIKTGLKSKLDYIRESKIVDVPLIDTEKMSVVQIHTIYSSIKKNIVVKRTFLRMKKIIAISSLVIEIIVTNFFGINIEGFSKGQSPMYNIYHSFFIEMGEEYLASQEEGSKMSPWVKILLCNAVYLLLFLVAGYFMPNNKQCATDLMKVITQYVNSDSEDESEAQSGLLNMLGGAVRGLFTNNQQNESRVQDVEFE